MKYSNDMDNISQNIKEGNPNKKQKILILIEFNDMIAGQLRSKKLIPIVTDLYIREKKLNISLVFITKCYFAVPKIVKLNSTQYFVTKIHPLPPTQKKQTSTNHSSDIDFEDFMNLYKKCTPKPYSFLIIDTTFAPDNSSRFKKNLSERI